VQRRSGGRLKIGLYLIFLLLLSGSLCGVLYKVESSSGKGATPGAPPELTPDIGATATATAQQLPEYFKSKGTLAFDDPLTGGSQWSGGSANGACVFQKSGLDVSVGATATNGINANQVAGGITFHDCIRNSTTQPGDPVYDFAYEVSMIIIKGNCGGIAFHVSGEKMYYFVACQDGSYHLVRYPGDPGQNITPTPEPNSISIDAPAGSINMHPEQNTVAVKTKGVHMDFYVNTNGVYSTDDPENYTGSYNSDQVGVIAKSLQPAVNDPTDVVFTNACMWNLSA
jgi:hypothetical protein